jgi:hypothetical protein
MKPMDHTIIMGALAAHLTSEHAASSYGLPVLVVNREAFGPADVVLDPEDPDNVTLAAEVVHAWASQPERTPEERDAARRYLGQWPEGPQLSAE